MKRVFVIHLAFLLVFLILTALAHRWIDLIYLPYLIGGLVGAVLPYLDHWIYVYFLKPQDSTSQTASDLLKGGNVVEGMNVLTQDVDVQKSLIFHSAHFQMIFVVFAFLVVTSSGSLLGRGIVLGFLLHLLVSEYLDWKEKGNIDYWFRKIPYELDQRQKKWYMIINAGILLVFGFLF